jgi:cyclase
MSTNDLDITEPGEPVLSEISPGIYAYIQPDGTWWINNTGFLSWPRGVISIDTCSTERRTRAYLRAITGVSPAPVRAVVNTHHHGDHTFGNCLLPAAAIVGHERTRTEAVEFGPPGDLPFWDGPDWGDLYLDPPFVTFSDRLTLHAGEIRAEVRYVGMPAHTTNDSIIWIPDRSVLFCGDLIFNGGTPFLLMGSVSGAIEVLESVIAPLEADFIVPGHGPVFGAGVRRGSSDSGQHGFAPIEATLDYLKFVVELANEGHRGGLLPLEAARRADLGRFASWPDAERLVGNLHRAYAELSGAPPGTALDTAGALADMVAFNGGAPLTCLA